ncbi:MAG: tetratricopeptide repeat protein [Pseudorhodoplanes sp.]
MRISSRSHIALGLGLAIGLCADFGATPTVALDGTRTPTNTPLTLTPVEAFRSGARALKVGEKEKAVTSLQYAAEKGHALAQWKLGRMYAEGDGVPRDDLRAFGYFSRIADGHADESPDVPQSRFVANAFVQLGHYYLEGIPNSQVRADPERAREMFSYAASYFGDADAQYNLARLYLDGVGAPRDPRQALRWLGLAAHKGQYRAQALLGSILFKGQGVARQGARGLMWLTLARDNALSDDAWIVEMYDSAMSQASPEEQSMALVYLERYLKGRRD